MEKLKTFADYLTPILTWVIEVISLLIAIAFLIYAVTQIQEPVESGKYLLLTVLSASVGIIADYYGRKIKGV